MRTDKTMLLAAERQEPLTAAEHAQLAGRQAEYARDVPRTCTCAWQWNSRKCSYELIGQAGECPWHAERAEDADPMRGKTNMTEHDEVSADEAPAYKKVRVDLAPPVHKRLQDRQRALAFARGRWVTFTEVFEELLEMADAQDAMVADALEGK